MKKVSKSKIIKTYATALYSSAVESKSLEKSYKNVQTLLGELENAQDFNEYMQNPLYSSDDKIGALKQIGKNLKLDSALQNCLEVMFENHRIAQINQVLKLFISLYYKGKNILEVSADTPQKLSASQEKKLAAALKNFCKQDVVIKYNVIPELLGGLRVNIGSQTFDDTVLYKLNYLEKAMKGEK